MVAFRQNLPYVISIFIALMTLYIFTMPHTVTLEDSGEFITVSYFNGIVHPPGYPLYTILAKLFTFIPVGSIAFRIHLLSAIFASLTCCFVYLLTLRLCKKRIPAVFSALLYGVSGTFWLNAIIAEVYSLNAFFFFTILYYCLKIFKTDSHNLRFIYLITLLFSLSLTNHWPLMLLSSISFLILLLPKRNLFLGSWKKLIPVFLLGLIPYIYLPVCSFFEPYFTYSGKIDSFDMWISYILRSHYDTVEIVTTSIIKNSILFFIFILENAIKNFVVLGFILAMIGMFVSYKRIGKYIFYSLFYSLIACSILLRFFLQFDYDIFNRELYLMFQIIPFGIIAIFAGLGLNIIYTTDRFTPKIKHGISIIVASLLIVVSTVYHWDKNNKDLDTFASDYARTVLINLPKNANLFLYGDTDIWPISYVHFIDNVRPDVKLYSQHGFLFGNRLFNIRKDTHEYMLDRVNDFILEKGRIFTMQLGPIFRKLKGFHIIDHGLFNEITTNNNPAQTIRIKGATTFLDNVVQGKYKKHWFYHRRSIIKDFCRVLVLENNFEHPIFKEHNHCKFVLARRLLKRGENNKACRLFGDVLKKAQYEVKHDWAQLLYKEYYYCEISVINQLQVSREEKLIKVQNLINRVLPAIDIYPVCENKILSNLLLIKGQWPSLNIKLNDLTSRFSKCTNLRQKFMKIH